MPKFFREHGTVKNYVLPLMMAAAENGVKHRKIMWECRGKCFTAGMTSLPVTPSSEFTYPSNTVWIICHVCGASSLYYDKIEAESTLVNPLKDVEKETSEFIRTIRNATLRDRNASKKRYEESSKKESTG